jgi:hypothetical protein
MSKEFLTIACKMPNGIILEVGAQGEENYQRITLNGANQGRMERGVWIPATIGGYGLTENVPAKVWHQWLAKHKRTPMVLNGLVYAHEEKESVIAFAGDHEKQVTGFEPLDPNKAGKITVDPDVEALRRTA